MDDFQRNENSVDEKSLEEKIVEFLFKIRQSVRALLAAKKQLAIFNLTIGVLTVLILFFVVKPYYTSTITILPDYGNKLSFGGLSNLASLAGIAVGDVVPTEIYENLIMSESVLAPVFYSKYKTEEFEDSVNLIQYFEIEPDDDLPPPLRERKMFLKLYRTFTKSNIKTELGRVTRILEVTVTMPESKLASEVANNIAISLDEYIRTKRKSFASNQRFYLEKRINQVKDSLTRAEELLKNFREKNRIVLQSPELLMEQARLIRNVEILQTVYTTITQQLELAKIDEIRDTPVLNIKEYTEDPIIKEGPKRLIILIVLMLLSFVGSSLYVLFLPQLKTYRSLLRQKSEQ